LGALPNFIGFRAPAAERAQRGEAPFILIFSANRQYEKKYSRFANNLAREVTLKFKRSREIFFPTAINFARL
jgi:hypothetical protein